MDGSEVKDEKMNFGVQMPMERITGGALTIIEDKGSRRGVGEK